ncbi:hypothetical protein SteCoe_12238 [Stentor coeruleus]|uniref:Uncharacterized protein n=1 Tax=Stentor coeruleus TaxID=5963 RepID=A0A1R2CB74_9CILI|nr:hypothetical protein SteCoe_12238 [Stentor coeruleus]
MDSGVNNESMKSTTKILQSQEDELSRRLQLKTVVIIKLIERENTNKAMKRLVLELENGNAYKIESLWLTQMPGTCINLRCYNNIIYTIHENAIYYFVRNQNINPGDVFYIKNIARIEVISISGTLKFMINNDIKIFDETLPFEELGILYRSGSLIMIQSTEGFLVFKRHVNSQPAPNNSDFFWDDRYFKIKYFTLGT